MACETPPVHPTERNGYLPVPGRNHCRCRMADCLGGEMKLLAFMLVAIVLWASTWTVMPTNVVEGGVETHGYVFTFTEDPPAGEVYLTVTLKTPDGEKTFTATTTVNRFRYAFLDVPQVVMAQVLEGKATLVKSTVNNEELRAK
jgi:hypothetical protein